MALKLYNTLGRKLEEFKPLKPNAPVGLYSCGPTVYDYPHIGNYRAYIFADTLKRVLEYNGHQVKHVMNITDVDDKTIRESQKAGKSLKDFTEFYNQAFEADRKVLNIKEAAAYPKASDYINEMVAMIETLIAKNYAYKTDDGDVYFSIKHMSSYGQLTNLKPEDQKTNAAGRIKKDEYDKDNVQDFALWKAWDEEDGSVFWETSLGKGRPGWHIECSAMSIKNLGESFDIHTGGVDNMFPHHENEIAQSECATGHHFVNYWLHNEWILVDGKKMAKSSGNFLTLRDLAAKNIPPLAYRYLLLTAHYRSQLNFTWESLEAASSALNRMYRHINDLFSQIEPGEDVLSTVARDYDQEFTDYLNDDLNTPQALALAWQILRGDLISPNERLILIKKWDTVLGLNLFEGAVAVGNESIDIATLPQNIQDLISQREQARLDKNWSESDRLRDELAEVGYEIKDTAKGSQILKK